MIGIHYDEINSLPEAKRLHKAVVIAAVIWLVAVVVFVFALSAMSANRERLDEAGRVLNGAMTIKSYPALGTGAEGKEPLAALSEIVDKLGLQSNVVQMSSSSSGLLLQISRLYNDDFTKLIEDIDKNGLTIKTAEIRAVSSQKDGRLIDATVTIGGTK
ncbi:MAG: type II secretion system protein GspM [Synergistes sp.]|nr:type II secretion system protein GspM [Synergistes sp.]